MERKQPEPKYVIYEMGLPEFSRLATLALRKEYEIPDYKVEAYAYDSDGLNLIGIILANDYSDVVAEHPDVAGMLIEEEADCEDPLMVTELVLNLLCHDEDRRMYDLLDNDGVPAIRIWVPYDVYVMHKEHLLRPAMCSECDTEFISGGGEECPECGSEKWIYQDEMSTHTIDEVATKGMNVGRECQCGSCEKYFNEYDLQDGTCPHCGSGNWIYGCIDEPDKPTQASKTFYEMCPACEREVAMHSFDPIICECGHKLLPCSECWVGYDNPSSGFTGEEEPYCDWTEEDGCHLFPNIT